MIGSDGGGTDSRELQYRVFRDIDLHSASTNPYETGAKEDKSCEESANLFDCFESPARFILRSDIDFIHKKSKSGDKSIT